VTSSEAVSNRMTSKWLVDPAVGIEVNGAFEPCKQWTGALDRGGYGKVSVEGKTCRTHRVSYALEYGSVPEGMVLDHLCKNRRCGNPLHLDPVTQKENVRRGDSPVGKAMRLFEAVNK